MTNKELADLIYPSLPHTPEDYEAMYPERDLPEGAMVTRIGPSPTGCGAIRPAARNLPKEKPRTAPIGSARPATADLS